MPAVAPNLVSCTRFLTFVLFCGSILLLPSACNYTQKITDGPTAYELMRFSEAVPLLTKEYNKTKSRVEQGEIAFMLGESYKALHKPSDAVDWYRRAYDYQYGPLALEQYAATLMASERYKEALAAYKELGLEIGSRYQYRRQMQAAEAGISFDLAKARYEVKTLPLEQDGEAYGPQLAGEQLLVSISSTTPTQEKTYAWSGNGYSDLYLVNENGSEAKRLEDRINSFYNEGAAAVSPNGSLLAFTRCAPMGDDAGYCKIYIAEREGDRWSEPQPLSFQEEEVNYMQPAWSADGTYLYFSSNGPDGVGGYDIYSAERMPPDEWSLPVRLPRAINTQANEHWPSLRGDTLYFASDGHAGFGGLDLFKTFKVGSDVWSNADNLQPPMNSGGDDLGITFKPTVQTGEISGYFSSNRNTGVDRIFSFRELPPPIVIDTTPIDTQVIAVLPKMLLEITVVEAVYSDPTNPGSRLLGKKPLESATLELNGENTTSPVVLEPGQWQLVMAPDMRYRFLAKANGYLSSDASFSTAGMQANTTGADQVYELEIELKKIYAGREIVLDDIYYDFDKAEIRSDAKPTLRELARDLQLNPELRIRLGSHTDCRGGDAYNRALSQRRAESAVQFLIEQGVNSSRLDAVGFGEDVPRTDCVCSRCDEDQHQLNRRTTFAILE